MIHRSIVCSYLYIITGYGYPPPAENTPRYLEQMKALGFGSVELEGIRQSHLQAVYNRRFNIAAKVRELGLQVPYFCVVLPGLASADPHTRNRNLALFRQGCEVAAALNARGVLDNAPLPPYEFPGDIPVVRHYDEAVLRAARLPRGLSWAAYWAELVSTYRAACDIAAEFGLTYQLHPCLGVLAATTGGFLHFRDAVGKDNLRFTLDTANQFFLKDNLALAVHRLAGCMDYIHLSDSRGSRLEHLPVGQGEINWEPFFEALAATGFQGHIAVDVGGSESNISNLEAAYIQTANWLARHLPE